MFYEFKHASLFCHSLNYTAKHCKFPFIKHTDLLLKANVTRFKRNPCFCVSLFLSNPSQNNFIANIQPEQELPLLLQALQAEHLTFYEN